MRAVVTDETLELRPSTPFLASAILSPAVLLVLGGWGFLQAQEFRWTPAVLFGFGVLLGVAVLWDLPTVVRLSPEGVVRSCVFRRQLIPWDEVTAISRTRVDRSGRRLVGRAVSGLRSSKAGGLVLVVGPKRRRYLLTDRQERPDQWHELQRLAPKWAPGIALPRPPAKV